MYKKIDKIHNRINEQIIQNEVDSSFDPDSNSAPIFILGINFRCGTNFLFELLRLHPECDFGGIIWEDGLLKHADLLIRYVNATYKQWNPDWKVKEIMDSDILFRYLGDSLISFLKLQFIKKNKQEVYDNKESLNISIPKRLVTKTPSVRNIQHFFKIFPDAYLLVIIRDGRSVIESGVKSFNWDYEEAMREWTKAAHTIVCFDQDNKNSNNKYLIIKYEDLFSNTKEVIKKILLFLNLDEKRYDFDTAMSLPVFGSSELREQGEEKIHWKPVKKRSNFDPNTRWHHWGRALHERFNWIAGDYLEKFGYTKKVYNKNQYLWIMLNILLDIKWKVRYKRTRMLFKKIITFIKRRILVKSEL